MGQVNVNDRSDGNGGPYYRPPDHDWSEIVRLLVWTVCVLIIIAVLAYVGVSVFDHIVTTVRTP